MSRRALTLVLALWWGGCTAIGFLVVPLLFASLPSAALAGQTAARLFSAEVYGALALGVAALLLLKPWHDHHASEMPERRMDGESQTTLLLVVGALLAALLMEFAVAPRILARENLKLWHTVGTCLYLLQWALSGLALWRSTCAKPAGAEG